MGVDLTRFITYGKSRPNPGRHPALLYPHLDGLRHLPAAACGAADPADGPVDLSGGGHSDGAGR